LKSNGINIRLFTSGYCRANSRHVFPAEPSEVIPFQATWALIDHPVAGKILFDTGYSVRFYQYTRSFPNVVYRWITPVFHKDEESCLSQLEKLQIKPDEIKYIVISHFHADHTGGLKDFPKARIWCSKEALRYMLARNRLTSVLKGMLKSQIPDDISERTLFHDDGLEKSELAGLSMRKWHEDIFFVDLPGHFRGQIGLLLKNTNHGDILLCADAAWSVRSIRDRIYPSKLVSLISDSYREMKNTIDKLHNLRNVCPDIIIIPTHCDEAINLLRK
jgi:glyoxylase-like metal-dependent hydrolase (beta-lactamase superfamily II)